MTIVRLKEPIFFFYAKQFCVQCFGIYLDESDPENATVGMNGTMISFLTSSLNVELVHIILRTVSEFTVGTAKSLTNWRVYHQYDFTNTNHFVLDCIEIENPENWSVDQVQEQ